MTHPLTLFEGEEAYVQDIKLTRLDPYAHLAVLVATFVVATSFPIGQRIAPFLDPVLVVLLRFLISILVMSPFLFFTDMIKIPTGRRLLQFGAVGGAQAGFFILMFLALQHTSSLNTSVIYTLLPSLAAIMGFYLLKERLRPLHLVLLPIGILATAWVIFEGSFEKMVGLDLNPGDLIFGAGLLLLALYSVLLKKFHLGGSPFDMVFWSMACAIVPMALYSVSRFGSIEFESVPLDVYLWIVYLALMTVFTNFVWAFGTPRLGPMKTMAYSYLIPSFVLFINWIIMGTLPPVIVLPGVLVGFFIMFVLQFGKNVVGEKSNA